MLISRAAMAAWSIAYILWAAGRFRLIWTDERGDFFVGEVIVNARAVKRMAPLRPAGFQKFRRRAG